MLQGLLLVTSTLAVPAPEADPQFWTGHPLVYPRTYVTYHAPTCVTEVEEIKGQSCQTKPVTDCQDVEIPSHRIKVENVCTKVKNARCGVHTLPAPVGVPVVLPGTIGRTLGYGYGKREADPQVLLPSVMPYHNCVNTETEVCYPVQSVEETTITEKSCTVSGGRHS